MARAFLKAVVVLAVLAVVPEPANASDPTSFCFYAGVYYDSNGTGWHRIDCYDYGGSGSPPEYTRIYFLL
jgi:hypothetical protein